jgi:membrane-bound lytic murein transglycosylase D
VPVIAKRWWLGAVLGLLQACASQPPSPPAPAAAEPQARSAVFGFEPAAPVAPAARPGEPVDARTLPPFDGERHAVVVPLRGLATIDRTVRPDDVWQRIRDGFAMPDLNSPLVQEKTAWYAARPDYLKRVFERGRLYLHHIVEEIEKRGLPTELALLPMVESSFNPMAYSRAHASGLWQFIPGTGRRYELQQNWWYDGRRDIVASTAAALGYLSDLYDMHGDWHLALASYNWGENAVARAIEKNRAASLPTDYASLTMPAETQHYVPKLQALKNLVLNPQAFGIQLDPIPNEPYFTTVTKTRDIDVQLAAKLAEMTVEEFVALNPGFSRPLIRASVTPRIVLPADKVEVFHENLTRHDENSLVSWKTYQPGRGEKLEAIAKKFGLSAAQLREVNGIAPRARALPAVMVVPTNGADARLRRMPIMYAPPIPVATVRRIAHTVKPGETLASIAARYRVRIEDLKRWNRLGRLLAGQKLTIEVRAPARGKPRSLPKGKPYKKANS